MNEENGKSRSKTILVIGGGISGITVAVEAAEVGYEVYLVERSPSLGGRVAQMSKYFPKLCPPACGLEINYQRLRKSHDRIKVFTLTEVESVTGQAGAFEVDLKIHPRFVNEKCTACGDCVEACDVERDNPFNCGMDKAKAIYLPHDMALPLRYVIDMDGHSSSDFAKCVEACKYDAIDLEMAPKSLKATVGSIVVATGWDPFDAAAVENLGFGTAANVITNLMMERMASPGGPTGGKILRPSDGKPPKKVVFAQCAGSRDANHLAYCSGVCCMAALKQTTYLREGDPEAEAHLFHIDLRASGVYEDFLVRTQEEENVFVKKGKVAKVEEDPETKDLIVEVEDILAGAKTRVRADMVVLAAGMTPASPDVPLALNRDTYGFCSRNGQPPGVIAAGTAKGPADVASAIQDATGVTLKAIHSMRRA